MVRKHKKLCHLHENEEDMNLTDDNSLCHCADIQGMRGVERFKFNR